MKEVKPICYIQYNPETIDSGNGVRLDVVRMNEFMSNKFPDYHVLCFPEPDLAMNLHMSVFHPKDFEEIQYNDLKNKVELALKNLK